MKKNIFERIIGKIVREIMPLVIKFHNSNLSTNSSSVFLENCIVRLLGGNHKFFYNKKDNIFSISEGQKQLKFSNKIRGFAIYRNGIISREKFIFSSYCLDNISFHKNDIVIDCGANFGDLMLKLESYIQPSNYIAIEPNPSDFEILKLNINTQSILINKALGKFNEKLPFYISSEDGDSSLVEPAEFKEVINVEVVRLDKLIEELNIKKIKLLKIEAEGYEPEVLEGLGSALKKCEYIAVDGGYERGVNSEQTFTTITNYLINNRFEIKDIYFPWCRALFINKAE